MIKQILKEEKSNVRIGDKSLPRWYGNNIITPEDVNPYIDGGYKPYYIENNKVFELPPIKGRTKNKWGEIYFFNDEESSKILKLQEKTEELINNLKEQIKQYDKYVVGYIHTEIMGYFK